VNYTGRQGLSDNVITAIAQDVHGKEETLWLGTNGGGLNRWRPAGIETLPGARGLPGTIYGILEDARGRLWLSSKTGIFRVSPALLKQTGGEAQTGEGAQPDGSAAVTGYGTADGMKIRECSGSGHPAACKLADGSLWFATLNGVSVIDPEHAPENRVPPPVVIEKVLVDDQVRSLNQELAIKPGANRLEFQYAGLSFRAPQKVKYRYRLQGFDHGWIDAGSRRAAFYTNLPPGPYRFQVLAANNDGVWNAAGASFALRQLPHYYQTYWFYSALALACLLLGYLFYRWRVLQMEAQWGAVLAERGRLAREIHDTLAQGFVGVSVQLELVARLLAGSRDAALQHLDQARALVRASLDEARTSIWNLRSEAAAAEDLPSRLRQSCTRMSSGSACKVYLQVKGTYRPVARKIEEELLRIGQEAVANAVRHSAATRIDVQLIYEGKQVSLRVEDDGRGFQPGAGAPEGHYGIRGMHERAGEIDAALLLESTPGGGTRVSVEAPLG
jgi:signal transduction histidine kinase